MELNFRCRTLRSKVRRILVVVSCVLWRKVFLWRRLLLLKVYMLHHTMLVLNAFQAISECLNLKVSRGSMLRTNPPSWLTLTRSKWAPPHPSIANLLRNSVSDNQSSSPRDLPLRPHLVRLLVGSHLPLKQPGYVPGSSYDLFHLTGNFLYCSFNRRCDWEIKAAKISHTYIHYLYFTSNLQSSSKANIFEKRKKW